MQNNKKNTWQEEFFESLKEIDNIYNETMEKLENLHKRKMRLIKEHKEKVKEVELNKLRHEIKGVDDN